MSQQLLPSMPLTCMILVKHNIFHNIFHVDFGERLPWFVSFHSVRTRRVSGLQTLAELCLVLFRVMHGTGKNKSLLSRGRSSGGICPGTFCSGEGKNMFGGEMFRGMSLVRECTEEKCLEGFPRKLGHSAQAVHIHTLIHVLCRGVNSSTPHTTEHKNFLIVSSELPFCTKSKGRLINQFRPL